MGVACEGRGEEQKWEWYMKGGERRSRSGSGM